MKCFNHSDKNSVAVCKACGKAVCHDCLHESEAGIACQQICLDQLAATREFYKKQADSLKNMKRLNQLGSLFSIVMGLVFIYFSTIGYGLVYDFILVLGAGFVIYGLVAQLVNVVIFLRYRNKPR